MTHFDAFDRPDTVAGTVSNGPQGQAYELFSNFLLAPDTISHIRGKRFYTPPPTTNTARASYLLTQTSAPVTRLGAVLEYTPNTEAPPGPSGYVWTIILSTTRNRFTDKAVHFHGTHYDWALEIWYPNGARRALGGGRFPKPLAAGEDGIVDMELDGNTLTVTVPGDTRTIQDQDFLLFADARVAILEHYIAAQPVNLQQFQAWYYQVEGSPALPRSVFAPFEP